MFRVLKYQECSTFFFSSQLRPEISIAYKFFYRIIPRICSATYLSLMIRSRIIFDTRRCNPNRGSSLVRLLKRSEKASEIELGNCSFYKYCHIVLLKSSMHANALEVLSARDACIGLYLACLIVTDKSQSYKHVRSLMHVKIIIRKRCSLQHVRTHGYMLGDGKYRST